MRGRQKVTVGSVVVLRKSVDLSDRWIPCTDQRKQECIPAGIRGRVVAIDDGRPERLDVRVEFPVLGLTEWLARGNIKVLPSRD